MSHPYDEDCECHACYSTMWSKFMAEGDLVDAIESGYLDEHLKTIARLCFQRAEANGTAKSSSLKKDGKYIPVMAHTTPASVPNRPFGLSDQPPAVDFGVGSSSKVLRAHGTYNGSVEPGEFRARGRLYWKSDFVGKLIRIKWNKLPEGTTMKVLKTGKGTTFSAQIVWVPQGHEDLMNKVYTLSYDFNREWFGV